MKRNHKFHKVQSLPSSFPSSFDLSPLQDYQLISFSQPTLSSTKTTNKDIDNHLNINFLMFYTQIPKLFTLTSLLVLFSSLINIQDSNLFFARPHPKINKNHYSSLLNQTLSKNTIKFQELTLKISKFPPLHVTLPLGVWL